MKKKKIRVRYRLSILYFIVGICISLFALFQLLGVYNAYLGELKDREIKLCIRSRAADPTSKCAEDEGTF